MYGIFNQLDNSTTITIIQTIILVLQAIIRVIPVKEKETK